MKITVCIGSTCHMKGAREVVEELQRLIFKNKLADKIELGGENCMGTCQIGVCVSIDGKPFSVTSETVEEFFEEEVLKKI